MWQRDGRVCGLWSIPMEKLVCVGRSGCWCGLRKQLQLLVEASPASAKCTVRMIRAGLVEAEESVEDGLVLVLSEDRFHVFNVFYVGKSRDMVEEGWCGPVGNVSVNLESRATADFPGMGIDQPPHRAGWLVTTRQPSGSAHQSG